MTDDERVTLRLPKLELQALDFFVEAGMFPNRSEAIRQAIKDLISNRHAEVEKFLETRQRLMESSAKLHNLKASYEQHVEQKLDKVETDALRKLGKR